MSLAGYQLGLFILEVGEGAESVEFQHENPIRVIKRARANKPHGFTRQKHRESISPRGEKDRRTRADAIGALSYCFIDKTC